MLVSGHSCLLAGVALILPAAAFSQPAGPSDPKVAPAPVAKAATPQKRVYTLADFARFAPKTAYDMLVQVPGFTIETVDTTTRGLGQASENVIINGQRIANKSGGAVNQLQRTPASAVDRIEIVDAAESRHCRPLGPGRQRHPQGDQEGIGPVRIRCERANPLHQAGAARRLAQLFREGRPGRLHALGRERFRPRRDRRADPYLRRQPCPDRDPQRGLSFRI